MDIIPFLRRSLLGTVAGALVFFHGLPAGAQSEPVQVSINGSTVDVNPAPVIQGGRVFVPLRGVFERLGASVVYNAGEIDATGSNGQDISLHLGSNQATVNGATQTIDVAPFLVGESTFVPLRFISQALGATVNWDQSQQLVAIDSAYRAAQAPQTAIPSYAYNTYDSYDSDDSYMSEPPPPIPYYEQPPVPAPDYIWQPGFWASNVAGYYWVPGTWVPAPQPNLLWTPGYWGFHNGYFGYHPGYWAQAVGFYGGINYGGGYSGNGYGGGRWQDDAFQYNTAVTHVTNVTIIKNVYVDKTVVNNYNTTTINRTSYNGGPNGVVASPSAAQLAAERGKRVRMTPVQIQHIEQASKDRDFLATVNGGKPPVVAVDHPFTAQTKPANSAPITTEDKFAAQKLIVHPTNEPAVTHSAPYEAPRTTEPIGARTEMPAAERTANPEIERTFKPEVERTVAPDVDRRIKPEVEETIAPEDERPPVHRYITPELLRTPTPEITHPRVVRTVRPDTYRPETRTETPAVRVHTGPAVKPRPKHTPEER